MYTACFSFVVICDILGEVKLKYSRESVSVVKLLYSLDRCTILMEVNKASVANPKKLSMPNVAIENYKGGIYRFVEAISKNFWFWTFLTNKIMLPLASVCFLLNSF